MSDGNETVTLTKEQLRELIKETVIDTLVKIGVDASKPIEMQKDFQHLRGVRTATEAINRKGLLALSGILVVGFCGAAWVGFKAVIGA